MSGRTKIGSFLGLLAGWVLSLLGRLSGRPGTADLRRAEFKTSTQHLGARFSEKIRRVFRVRWLKAYTKTDTECCCRPEQGEESGDSQ